MLTTDARTERVAPAALPATQATLPTCECGHCGGSGLWSPFGDEQDGPCDYCGGKGWDVDEYAPQPLTDAEIEQQARHTHERVLAGELAWNAVYGDDGFCPFA